jgi:hypothetical protein
MINDAVSAVLGLAPASPAPTSIAATMAPQTTMSARPNLVDRRFDPYMIPPLARRPQSQDHYPEPRRSILAHFTSRFKPARCGCTPLRQRGKRTKASIAIADAVISATTHGFVCSQATWLTSSATCGARSQPRGAVGVGRAEVEEPAVVVVEVPGLVGLNELVAADASAGRSTPTTSDGGSGGQRSSPPGSGSPLASTTCARRSSPTRWHAG